MGAFDLGSGLDLSNLDTLSGSGSDPNAGVGLDVTNSQLFGDFNTAVAGDNVPLDANTANPSATSASSGGFWSGIGNSLGGALTIFGTQAANAEALNLRDRIRAPTVTSPQAQKRYSGSQNAPSGAYTQGLGLNVTTLFYGSLALLGVALAAKLLTAK